MAAEYARGPLTSQEHYALRAAHRTALIRAAGQQQRVATIRDVIEALYRPEEDAGPAGTWPTAAGVRRRRDPLWTGPGDGPGAVRRRRSVRAGRRDHQRRHRLVRAADGVFDTSELAELALALSLAMALVCTFLSSVWAVGERRRRITGLEGGYHTTRLTGPSSVSVASILRPLVRRGRGIGLVFFTVAHHVSDILQERMCEGMSLGDKSGARGAHSHMWTGDVLSTDAGGRAAAHPVPRGRR